MTLSTIDHRELYDTLKDNDLLDSVTINTGIRNHVGLEPYYVDDFVKMKNVTKKDCNTLKKSIEHRVRRYDLFF